MAFVRAGPTLPVQGEEGMFERRLVDLMNHFLIYEEKRAQDAALAVVPLEDLTQIASAKYDSCRPSSCLQKQDEIRDLLLLELLNWFKSDFFTWMDSPPCPLCSAPGTTPLMDGMPSFEEKSKSAARVETFTCHKCFPPTAGVKGKEVARFPRYNDPVILLETRSGRCGEWSNCFTLICRAIGFEIRHVTDWTDHVWVEVFSATQNRWIHCDPCENTCDNPLLYETGWGKKLSYVIAVSQDDIQDVTWRYSHSDNHKQILSRRTAVREIWLVKTITGLRKHRQSWLPEPRKKILEVRLIKELVEFLSPTKSGAKDTEKIGRESGSLAWRLMRGEIESKESPFVPFEWKLSGTVPSGKFNLTYDCAQDKYHGVYTSVGASESQIEAKDEKRGWMSGVFLEENIIRKEERDWKMVYLSRQGESKSNIAKIAWKFIVPDSIKRIKSLEFIAQTNIFHPTASIFFEITTNSVKTLKIPQFNCDKDGKWEWKSDEFQDCSSVMIICTLQGGQSWQHAQLFRQHMSFGSTSSDSPSFSVNIIFGE